MNFLEALKALKAQYDREAYWPGWYNLERELKLPYNITAAWRNRKSHPLPATLRSMNKISNGYFSSHLDDYWYYSANGFCPEALKQAIKACGYKGAGAFFRDLSKTFKDVSYARPLMYYWLKGGKPSLETVKCIHDLLGVSYGGLMSYDE